MEWWSLVFFKGFWNWRIFCQMVMEWWMLIILDRVSSDRIWGVSFTSSSVYSVYDGEVYIHSPVARTFFCCTVCLRTSAHLHACAHTRMAQVHEKGFDRMCAFVLHLAFSLLMSHPSLLFPHGDFETTPDYDLTDDPVHTFLPYSPVLKAQAMRNSAPASRSLATWPSQMQTQVMSPTSSTRSLPWTVTRCSSTIRTTISFWCSHSVWIFCFARYSWWFCSSDSKASMQSRNRCWTERKRKEREGFVICRIDAKQRKVNRTVFVWVWRVTENSILKSLRKFYSDGWDLREHLQRRAQQAVIGEIQIREDYTWLSTAWRSRIWREKNWEDAFTESQLELESQRRQLLKANQGQIKLNEREYTCVADWRWRIIFIKDAPQEVVEKLKKLKRRCSWKEFLKNNEDGKNFLRSMIRNHEQWVYWLISDEDYKND